MNLEDSVLMAQQDESLRDNIIDHYKNFICSCASKVTGKYVTEQDDEMSVAMIAFNEAITKYDCTKGSFLNFANITIKSRLIDFLRAENKSSAAIPFSELQQTDIDGNEAEFDVADPKNSDYEIRLEIEALTKELGQYQISFFDLPKATPKSKKTKAACATVIKHIIQNPVLVNEIKLKGSLPIKTITDRIKAKRKVIERHRIYIITAVIILAGEYEFLSEYFKEREV